MAIRNAKNQANNSGLIFLKYISDAFEEKREQLLFGFSDPKSEWFIKDEPQRADAAENRDEYMAANFFWLPPEARWHNIKLSGSASRTKQGRIHRQMRRLSAGVGRICSKKSANTITSSRPAVNVGAADVEDDGEPFEQKMKRLTTTLETQFAESAKLEKSIRRNLEMINKSV
jgi:hypothetical protein